MTPSLKRQRRACFLVVTLLTLFIHFPALFQTPRADQLCYLAEVAPIQDWWTLAIRSFALNRHRVIMPGDHLLFRPVFYFVLGTEKWLFGYRFIFWQATGLLLHLGVLGWLLKHLFRQGLRSFALLLTCFFATLPSCMEMVVWEHVHGYLVFVLCVAIGLDHCGRLEREGTWSSRATWRVAICSFLASYSYEVGAVFFLLIAGYLGLRGRQLRRARSGARNPPVEKWVPLAIGLPGLLYPLCSALEYGVNHSRLTTAPPEAFAWNIFLTLKNALLALIWWCFSGPFSSTLTFGIEPFGRLGFALGEPLFGSGKGWLSFPSLLSVIAAGALAGCGWLFLKRALLQRGRRWPDLFQGLLLGMLILYAGIVAIGRMNSRGCDYALKQDLYYGYPAWLLLILLLASILAAGRAAGAAAPPVLRRVAVGALFLMIGVNGFLVYRVNAELAIRNAPFDRVIQDVELLIREHGKEPDFSFFVPVFRNRNPEMVWNFNGVVRRRPLLAALYPSQAASGSAKYVLDAGGWRVGPVTGARRRPSRNPPPP